MKYKIRLNSGRIVGPMGLERIQKLIQKKRVLGHEQARVHPDGEWKNINQIAEIAELLFKRAKSQSRSAPKKEAAIKNQDPGGVTALIDEDVGAPVKEPAPIITQADGAAVRPTEAVADSGEATIAEGGEESSHEDSTIIQTTDAEEGRSEKIELESPLDLVKVTPIEKSKRKISELQTVVFQRPVSGPVLIKAAANRPPLKRVIRVVTLLALLSLVGYEAFFETPPARNESSVVRKIRPEIPVFDEKLADPAKSQQLYSEGLKFYVKDTLGDYEKAAKIFFAAARYDIKNAKAIALLASSYLNLLDVSNKDDKYFSTVFKLLEMARSDAIDLPEAVIADVEFYLTANRNEAARNRLVEYTKTHDYGNELIFFLASVYFSSGDLSSAAKYIREIPDEKIFSPRVFFLRGQIYARFEQYDEAVTEFKKAIALNPDHLKSHVELAGIYFKKGDLNGANKELKLVFERTGSLEPLRLARAHFFRGMYHRSKRKLDLALADFEKAVVLDRNNPDYRVELYTLRFEAGESVESARKQAKMYYHLGVGEKEAAAGRPEEARIAFVKAREENSAHYLPLMRIGDMYLKENDVKNALESFRKAVKLSTGRSELWEKLASSQIQAFEWEEAKKSIALLAKVAANSSKVDRLMGELYAKQGLHLEAIAFYRRAMGWEMIDPAVYVAYANSLLEVKRFDEAPFFFALARRFDPMNADAIIGTAKALAEKESTDRAVQFLIDELQSASAMKAELMAGLAELQIQSGDREGARSTIDEAIAVKPAFPNIYKAQAEFYQKFHPEQSSTPVKVLEALQAYIDRNPSDPIGYVERYKIHLTRKDLDKALDELNRVYGMFPRFPNLHYYRGEVYSQNNQTTEAVKEFQIELQNHPANANAMLALGKEYLKANATNEALTQFSLAMRVAPHESEPKNMAAYVNYLLKNYDGAIALYRAAIGIDPGNPVLYKRLGQAFFAIGDRAAASEAFRKYLELAPDAPDRSEIQAYL